MVRHRRAEGHAARDRSAHECRREQGAGGARADRAPARAGRVSDDRDGGGLCEIRRRRAAPLCQGSEGSEDRAAMTTATNTLGVRQPLAGVVYPAQDDLRRYVEAGVLGSETLPEAFAESFRRNAKRTAVCGPEGTLTYEKLDELTDRAGAALLRLGLKPLDRVMFQLGNSPEFLIAFIGCLKAGLIPVCTLAAHRENEIGYLARHAQARGHIVQGDEKFDLVTFASELKARIPSMHAVLSARGAARTGVPRLEDLMQQEDPAQARRRLQDVPRDPFQAAVFQLSGGTTGVPKLIPRFHNEYAYNMRAVARYMDHRRDDVMYMPPHTAHTATIACTES